MRLSRLFMLGACAALAASSVALVGERSDSVLAAPTGTITSTGPLTNIVTSPTLNCAVALGAETAFYNTTGCGTFVVVNGILFGPSTISDDDLIGSYTDFVPVSQIGPTGTGTASDPYTMMTKVSLPGTTLTATQTDTYTTGQQGFTTSVKLTNTSEFDVAATIYRAGDCFAAGINGTGEFETRTNSELERFNSASCLASNGRSVLFSPLTPGGNAMHDHFYNIWYGIAGKLPFPDTDCCSDAVDDGAGLSWGVTVEANRSEVVSSTIGFGNDFSKLDSDGDGLLDEWEKFGFDFGNDDSIDVNLPKMGATSDHRNLFIEADWMEQPCTELNLIFFRLCVGGRSFAPMGVALNDVRAAFENAPLSNPDGTTGVWIHIDSGKGSAMSPAVGQCADSRLPQPAVIADGLSDCASWKFGATLWEQGETKLGMANQVTYTQSVGFFAPFNPPACPFTSCYDWTEFDNLKEANFDKARRSVFHYALYADTYGGSGSSGISQGILADSFIVSDGGFGAGGFSRRQEAGTFMHELGHALNLRHGGNENTPFKPNYESIMNYAWQLEGSVGAAGIDYARVPGVELDETALRENDATFDTPNNSVRWFCPSNLSPRVRRPISKSSDGIVNWNCSGPFEAAPVSVDINNDGAETKLNSPADWKRVAFDGGEVGVSSSAGQQGRPISSPLITEANEISAAELRAVGVFGSDGDGSVGFVGPVTLLKGETDQTVMLKIENIGSVPATYKASVSGAGTGVSTAEQTVTIPAGKTQQVVVPVAAGAMTVGTYELTATLTKTTGEVLASTKAPVSVADVSGLTPAQIVELKKQIAALLAPEEYIPLTPARFLETRISATLKTFDRLAEGGGLRSAGSTLELQITGRNNIPSDAKAVALNVAVTGTQGPGFVTVFPCGEARPDASNLNYSTAGVTIPNLVIAKIPASGKVCLYTLAGTHMTADVNGYFPASSSYIPLTPARFLETRIDANFKTFDRQAEGGGLRSAGSTLELQITGRNNIPADAKAVVLNVAVTGTQSPGFVTVFPCGEARPDASNLNYSTAGVTIPNLVIAKIPASGKVCLYTLAGTDMTADVNGYFPASSSYIPLTPARFLETRISATLKTFDRQAEGGGLRSAGSTFELQIAGRNDIPADAKAVVLNVAVTGTQGPGFVTVFPCGEARPDASNLNYSGAGQTIPNLVIAKIPASGKVCLYTLTGTHMTADVNGYFPAD